MRSVTRGAPDAVVGEALRRAEDVEIHLTRPVGWLLAQFLNRGMIALADRAPRNMLPAAVAIDEKIARLSVAIEADNAAGQKGPLVLRWSARDAWMACVLLIEAAPGIGPGAATLSCLYRQLSATLPAVARVKLAATLEAMDASARKPPTAKTAGPVG